MRSKTMSQCSGVLVTPWGKVDIVRIVKAMSQCSGVLVTPWGKVDIAKDLWLCYKCSEAIYDFMGAK